MTRKFLQVDGLSLNIWLPHNDPESLLSILQVSGLKWTILESIWNRIFGIVAGVWNKRPNIWR